MRVSVATAHHPSSPLNLLTSVRRTPTQRRSDWGRSWWLAAIAGLVMAGFAAADPLTITTTSLPEAAANVPYTATLQATGGTSPYTWSVAGGALPGGFVLETSGLLHGTPTQEGSYQVSFQVTDATATKAVSATITLVIDPSPLIITTTSLPRGTTTIYYSYDQWLQAAGGTPPYNWTATGIPDPMFFLPTGEMHSYTGFTYSGTYTIHATVTDSATPPAQASKDIVLVVDPGVLDCYYNGSPSLYVGLPYSASLSGRGGTGFYSYSGTGLPPGIGMTSGGAISGSPTTAGVFGFNWTEQDSAGSHVGCVKTLTVFSSPIVLSPATLSGATVGTAYSQTVSASGGTAPYTFAVVSGTLPAGLTLEATGLLHGTPTTAGNSPFTLKATDAAGLNNTQQYTLTVLGQPLQITVAFPQGATGSPYAECALTATGGTPPYYWAVPTGMPDGMWSEGVPFIFNGKSWISGLVVHGTPANSGTFPVTLSVMDSSPSPVTATAVVPFVVVAAPLQVKVLGPIWPYDVGGPFDFEDTTVSGGTGAYTWSLSAGSLPPGITLKSPPTGSRPEALGTPTTAGTYHFTLQAKDSAGTIATADLTVVVASAPTISTTSLPAAMVGKTYPATTLTASGGQNYFYQWQLQGAPAGLSIGSTTGVMSGTVTGAPATYSVTVSTYDGSVTATKPLPLQVLPPLAVTTASLPAGAPGVAYASTKLTGSGGNPPYVWTAAGLPPGLTLARDGTLSGTPTVSGAYPVILTIADSVADGYSASKTISISVTAALGVATTALPPAMVGKTYSQTLSAVNGVAPYTWTLATGSLPAGVVLNASSGVISGTPTTVGTYAVGFHVTDTAGATATVALTLVVAPAGATRQGVFSQVAAGGGWTTSLYLVNQISSAVPATVNFWADQGTPLALPFTVTQAGSAQMQSGSTVSTTIGANSTVLIECASSSDSFTGWVEVASATPIGGYGVFHYLSPAGVPSEGTVPMETNYQTAFLLPYEAKNGFGMGLAVANLEASQATQVTVSSWGQDGAAQSGTSFNLLADGHKSLMLSDLVPAATGDRGLLRFTSSGGNIAGLGIRVNPAGAFASTKALETPAAGSPASTGVFAQVAAGGGWTTSLYLTNPTATPATATLSFWGDGGAALALPLTVTDADGTRSVTAASLSESIGPNSMVLIDCGPAIGAAETGWAQVALGANSQVVGHGVFHYTSPAGVESEGTVPMDTASGSSFVLPYEAANQFDMGVALANLSPSSRAIVSVTLADENGVTLTGTNVELPVRGHASFMLSGQVPAAARNRGWLRFSAPAGIAITGLGLRANPAGGFTSVPKL